jgi:hypothetical protein
MAFLELRFLSWQSGGLTVELWRLRASTANHLKNDLCWQDYFEKSRL